jgi:hypothetical protein
VALSRGFPRVDLPTTLPFDVRTFLGGASLRGCLTRKPTVQLRARNVKLGKRERPTADHAQTLRSSPTTRPSTLTSLLRIGSIVSFSGCRRMWSASLK